MITRLVRYWPFIRRFGPSGVRVAQTLFPRTPLPSGALGSVCHSSFSTPVVFRHGTTDASVFCQIFVQGIYRLKLPFAPRSIVDAGANAGYSSLFFHQRFPNAEIAALEAEESNFDLLEINTQANSEIHPIHAALWYDDGHISKLESKNAHSAFRFDRTSAGSDSIFALSPSSLMKRMNWNFIDLFKINIEGGEKAVFGHGPYDWIPKVRVFIMDLHDRFLPGCSEAVMSALGNWSFEHQRLGDLHVFLRQ